ncbi:L,D-transpeptidase [Patulibacter sp. NPDC049589]|uniref:L,D-transpeptidase n=1 Tax=Patulibacter sp. NPDC049589 TaxID=3154731 RepID=UPI0034393401
MLVAPVPAAVAPSPVAAVVVAAPMSAAAAPAVGSAPVASAPASPASATVVAAGLGARRRAAVACARTTSPAGTALPDFDVPAAPRAAVPAAPGAAATATPGADPLDDPVTPPFPITPPSRDHGSTSALIVAPTTALDHAGSGRAVWRIPVQTTWSSQPMILLVLESVVRDGRRWLRVRLPTRPAGQDGWIPYDHTVVGQGHFWINVNRARRLVRVYHYGRRVRRFRAVVGAPRTPTPKGLAAIYERNRQPDPRAFLGPWAVALTLTSNVLQEFDGGPGRIGIHGRGGASLKDPLGSARSHGCVRVDNDDISWVARRIPQGTPVLVR